MHRDTNPDTGIAIFAKAPIDGYAKSRLIPSLGPKKAAELQGFFIRRTVEIAVASNLGPVSLWCTPSTNHELFSSIAVCYRLDLHHQRGPDLGARMLDAFEVLAPAGPLLVIGTDCLVLAASHLAECATALHRGCDAVFLPTEDGGYALIGLKKPESELFCDIPWSTNRVMAETRLRAKEAGLSISEPALLWDVDTPEDYQRALAAGLFD